MLVIYFVFVELETRGQALKRHRVTRHQNSPSPLIRNPILALSHRLVRSPGSGRRQKECTLNPTVLLRSNSTLSFLFQASTTWTIFASSQKFPSYTNLKEVWSFKNRVHLALSWLRTILKPITGKSKYDKEYFSCWLVKFLDQLNFSSVREDRQNRQRFLEQRVILLRLIQASLKTCLKTHFSSVKFQGFKGFDNAVVQRWLKTWLFSASRELASLQFSICVTCFNRHVSCALSYNLSTALLLFFLLHLRN